MNERHYRMAKSVLHETLHVYRTSVPLSFVGKHKENGNRKQPYSVRFRRSAALGPRLMKRRPERRTRRKHRNIQNTIFERMADGKNWCVPRVRIMGARGENESMEQEREVRCHGTGSTRTSHFCVAVGKK